MTSDSHAALITPIIKTTQESNVLHHNHSSSQSPSSTSSSIMPNNNTNNNNNNNNNHIQDQSQKMILLTPVNKSKLKRQLSQFRDHLTLQRHKLTLFSQPISTMSYFAQECRIQFIRLIQFCLVRHLLWTVLSLSLVSLVVSLRYIQGAHQALFISYWNSGYVALEWIVLGVLSSVGLGTGLHTFLLYLGPFIAKVTMAANECGSVNFDLYGPSAFLCNNHQAETTVSLSTQFAPSFWTIVQKVQFAALCWGLGTAIGELPPYFVARAARLAGKMQESVEDEDFDSDIDNDDEDSRERTVEEDSTGDLTPLTPPASPLFDTGAPRKLSFVMDQTITNRKHQQSNTTASGQSKKQSKEPQDVVHPHVEECSKENQTFRSRFSPSAIVQSMTLKIKPYLTYLIQHYAFVAILILSSIPNPLFDLAGITCGYSLIPFWTFFGATILGKAVLKAHLQSFLVVVVFSKKTLEWIINEVDYHLPQKLQGKMSQFFENERKRFHPEHSSTSNQSQTSVFKLLWDLLLCSMIAYFVVSIINSTAQTRVMQEHRKEMKDFKEKTKSAIIQDQDSKT